MNEYDSSRISDLMGSDQNYEMASCEEEAEVLSNSLRGVQFAKTWLK